MKNASSPTPGFAIPGWRVIVSDTGRFWASRETPFPHETEWYAPPYRTVDGDTFEQLRAEVAAQEEAAEHPARGREKDVSAVATRAVTRQGTTEKAAGRDKPAQETAAKGTGGEVIR